MIFAQDKALFIHIPKTVGNSLQSLLVERSDDSLVTYGHQDGKDRFEVRGSITKSKHASVTQYAEAGLDISSFTVISTVRDPFERAVSLFFSPHRWMRQSDDGTWSQVDAVWNENDFTELVMGGKFQSMTNYLQINNQLPPKLELIRFENLQTDTARVLAKVFDITLNANSLSHVNKSSARNEEILNALGSAAAREAVNEAHREDFEVFHY